MRNAIGPIDPSRGLLETGVGEAAGAEGRPRVVAGSAAAVPSGVSEASSRARLDELRQKFVQGVQHLLGQALADLILELSAVFEKRGEPLLAR